MTRCSLSDGVTFHVDVFHGRPYSVPVVRVLLTGGAGYVGSQTARTLARQGHQPVVLDTLENGHRGAIDDIDLVVGSAADQELVGRLIRERDIEAVMHFAALKSAPDSVAEPGRYFMANVADSLALLAALEASAVRWFVFSSTCAVYGQPKEVPITEESEPLPENPYGESKLLVERALRWFEPRGVTSVSLRYFNAAGADLDGIHGEDWRKAENLVPVAIKSALGRSGPLRVFGTDYPTDDGTAVRDYVHVADLADAHIRALDYLTAGNPSTTLNLGTGQGTSVREVIAAVERATGETIEVVPAPRRVGDPAAVWADSSRAEEVLGWRARLDFDEIVRSAARWHSDHPDGYPDAPPDG
jgi:UDP-glucose-4-epimerase GalE